MIAPRRWGPIDAAVVFVLVHGVMDRAASFNRLGRRLAEHPGVAAVGYDRRGYEGSIELGPGDLDDHAADLAEVVAGLDNDRVVVFGHSYGGTVAWHAVASGLRPALVATYESPIPHLPGYRDRLTRSTLEVADRAGPTAAVEHFGRAVLGPTNWDALRPAFRDQRLAEGPAVVSDLRSLETFEPLVAPEEVARLVGYGSVSGAAEEQAAQHLAEAVGVRATALAGAGHGVHLAHPSACAGWLLDASMGR